MLRSTVICALSLALAPSLALAQSLSITSANGSGDCTGTSFHQAADASGRYVAAEWAVAGQFPIGVNRGRARCTLRFNVAVTQGYKIVAGGGSGLANRVGIVQMTHLRLNGATSGVLVESSIALDNAAETTASAMINGGPMTGSNLNLDRPTGSTAYESACSTAAKSTFQLSAIVDAATASNYVIPWPPEPYAQRETASMGGVRLFYSVIPCGPSRSAGAEIPVVKP